jgi:hypothetical protein
MRFGSDFRKAIEVVSLYARLMAVAVREEREKEKRCDELEV